MAHSQRVHSQALNLAPTLGEEADLLAAAAAIAHDIGYARAAVDTGQHEIDGARYLRAVVGADPLCSIVAFHTSSSWEGIRTRVGHALNEFGPAEPELAGTITYCDWSYRQERLHQRNSAPRSTPPRTTTPAPCCGTTTPGPCGDT
ncbi:HD domain-containing protein [Streptomyces sp. NPDC056656]|uniref:HD domain-containing protein n=1 Tax=Streptomyces sp. NPDC056656 TaxID=3345895 RepID=UPI0036B7533E